MINDNQEKHEHKIKFLIRTLNLLSLLMISSVILIESKKKIDLIALSETNRKSATNKN